MQRWLILLAAAMVLAGCASNAPPVIPSEPVAGLAPATQRSAFTSEQLIQIDLATIGFAEWYVARIAGASDALFAQATTPEARREAAQLKATQGTAVYSIVSGPQPIVQVLDLAMLVNLTRMKWIDEGRARQTFGPGSHLLSEALEEAMQRGHQNALRVVSEEELAAVRDAVRRWRVENPEITDVEFIRFEDFITERARALAPQDPRDLLGHLRSASMGLSETRLLGERALFLMTRFPRLARWQLEAQMADAQSRPEFRQMVGDMSSMSKAIGDLQSHAARLDASLDTMPQRMVDAVSSSRELKEVSTSAAAMLDRAQTAIGEMSALQQSVRGLGDQVAHLNQRLDEINVAYNPAALQKMADEGRAIASREVRQVIYLITACLAGLLAAHALLRRWANPRHDARR